MIRVTGAALGHTSSARSHITAAAVEFPEWGTKRTNWRECDLMIRGDQECACRLLDWINVI